MLAPPDHHLLTRNSDSLVDGFRASPLVGQDLDLERPSEAAGVMDLGSTRSSPAWSRARSSHNRAPASWPGLLPGHTRCPFEGYRWEAAVRKVKVTDLRNDLPT